MTDVTDNRQIVVTGTGLVTCLGLDVAETWSRVRAGACGIGASSAMQSTPVPDKGYGQAAVLPADYYTDAPREVRYLRRAIDEAVAHAGLVDSAGAWRVAPERCGVVLGTTLHGMPAAGRFCRDGQASSLSSFLAGSTLSLATEGLPATGQSLTTCAACASGLMSLGLGMSLLKRGELDVVIAGGYDPVSEYAYGGFNSLRLIAETAQQPFSRHRQGLKLAEGYGVLVLEREEDVAARDGQPVARLLSCTASADAHHLSQPHPEGAGASRAIAAALGEAGIAPDDVALIVAHATATPDNDRAESVAYGKAFGEALASIPVTAMKSHLGHTLGAAGAVELILAIQALRASVAPALANVKQADVEFDGLRVVTGEPAALDGRYAVVTSLGFGGSNACAVIEVGTESSQASTPVATPKSASTSSRVRVMNADRQPVVTGIGTVYPGAVGNVAFVEMLRNGNSNSLLSPDPAEIAPHLNTRRTRRMSEYVKLSLAATAMACADAGLDDVPAFPGVLAAITGTTHGSAKFSDDYYRQIVAEGVDFANPLLFAEGVPNAGTAHLSMMLGLTGPCQTLIGTRTAGLDALRLAATRIAQGEWDAALVGAGEEAPDLVRQVYEACGLHTPTQSAAPFAGEDGFTSAAGAVTLMVESRASAERRGARVHGVFEGWAQTGWGGRSAKAGVARVSAMLQRHKPVEHVISSANGTWLDRVEALALRIASSYHSMQPAVSAAAPRLHETFSAGPLLGIAATLLSRETLGLEGGGLDSIDGLRAATQGEPVKRFGVVCSDYNGSSSAVWLGVEP